MSGVEPKTLDVKDQCFTHFTFSKYVKMGVPCPVYVTLGLWLRHCINSVTKICIKQPIFPKKTYLTLYSIFYTNLSPKLLFHYCKPSPLLILCPCVTIFFSQFIFFYHFRICKRTCDIPFYARLFNNILKRSADGLCIICVYFPLLLEL